MCFTTSKKKEKGELSVDVRYAPEIPATLVGNIHRDTYRSTALIISTNNILVTAQNVLQIPNLCDHGFNSSY